MYKGWILTVPALIGAFILLAAIGAKPAMAQTGLAGQPVEVCVAHATPDMNARALFAGQGRFDCTTRQTALGRVGEPEEIGGVIASLLCDENRWINAQNIEVSGGYII